MGAECGERAGAVIVVIGLVAGLSMLVVGLVATMRIPDANEDFRVLASKCAITNVFHEMTMKSRHNHATKKSDKYCLDTYTYVFAWCADGSTCAPSAAPAARGDTTPRANYRPPWSAVAKEVEAYRAWWASFPPPAAFAVANTGWEPELLVSGANSVARGSVHGHSCQALTPNSTQPDHHAGDWVTCYQPTRGGISGLYACGSNNTACIKVLDPADDLEDEETSASEALYVGLFATACFAFCLLGLMYGAGWSCRTLFCGDADESEGEGEGEGVPRGNSGASLQKVRPA